ncbi:MAG: hypothetical protein MJZ76_10615 [Bacteroidales bacterium]|nr:hypothetical protein [Bacteroidales bacterium]
MYQEINKYNFDKAKLQIQNFASNLPESVSITRIQEKKWFFNHSVTGEELNAVTSDIQSYFISTLSSLSDTIRAFNDIYKALEFLDSEYISAIATIAKDAETASKSAEEISNKTKENTSNLENAQNDIKKNLEGLKQTIAKFKEFKISTEKNLNNIVSLQKRVNCQKHFDDIDKIWSHTQDAKSDISKIQGDLGFLKKDIEDKKTSISKEIIRLNGFQEKLRKQIHVHDIDELWNNVQEVIKTIQEQKNNLNTVNDRLDTTTNDIASIKDYYRRLQNLIQESKNNINKTIEKQGLITTNIECIKKDYSKQHTQIQENYKTQQELLQENMKSLNNVITNMERKTSKKLALAYCIGGLSLIISIVLFVLNFAS